MRNKISFLLVCFVSIHLHAQDHSFLNPQQALLNFNPSFAGSNGLIRYQSVVNYEPYEAGATNSVDGYIAPLRMGLGLSVNNTRFSTVSRINSAAFTYAQHFLFLDNTLRLVPSLQLGYAEGRLSHEFIGQIQGTPYVPVRKYLDLGGGFLVNYKNLYVGLGAFHINTPNAGYLDEYLLPTRFVFNMSYNMFFSEKHLLNIAAEISSQMAYTRLTLRVNAVLFKHLVLGTSYSAGDRLSGSLGFRHNFFSITASYSRPMYYGIFDNSIYELGMSFNLRNKEKRKVLTSIEAW